MNQTKRMQKENLRHHRRSNTQPPLPQTTHHPRHPGEQADEKVQRRRLGDAFRYAATKLGKNRRDTQPGEKIHANKERKTMNPDMMRFISNRHPPPDEQESSTLDFSLLR